MNILVVGSGGREHALLWKLRQSPRVASLYIAPGNGGTADIAAGVPLPPTDREGLARFAAEKEIDLVLVGPEAPLVDGLADFLVSRGITCLGPSREGARLEGSKVWAKEFMARHGIPTAPFRLYQDAPGAARWVGQRSLPLVIKADGLAAGKGARVCATREEALETVEAFLARGELGDAGRSVVIEDCLVGEEISLLALTDGKDVLLLPAAQDHKRIGEGDTGPNTGGMGAYAPAPLYDATLAHRVNETIVQPTLRGLHAEGIPYRGVLYFGLMVTAEGPYLLEYNCRFGDPETQVILPLLEGDLAELLWTAATGTLGGRELARRPQAAACVVLASGGYPGSYQTGFPIDGVAEASASPGVVVFHAGTHRDADGGLVTAGGRVLGVTGIGDDLPEAFRRAYHAADLVRFRGAYLRRDIGRRMLIGGPSCQSAGSAG